MPHISTVVSAGSQAADILGKYKTGKVFGRTSRGDFLLVEDQEIIFLSFEKSRGPLTLNINPISDICSKITVGDVVEIKKNGIYWPAYSWLLTYPPGPAWLAGPPSTKASASPEIYSRLKSVSTALLQNKNPGQISGNLIHWLNLADIAIPDNLIPLDLQSFRSIDRINPNLLAAMLAPLVGLGDGLTPSGDDLILGFILTQARWVHYFQTYPALSLPDSYLYEIIDRKTTRLSRALIKAAGLGQADERIIQALDGIITGKPDVDITISSLADWGNHSGIDTLTGITLYYLLQSIQ